MIHLPGNFTPALILLAGAGILALLSGRPAPRRAVALVLPVLTLFAGWDLIGQGRPGTLEVAGFTLVPVQCHAGTKAFFTVFCLALLGGTLYALGTDRAPELPAAFVHAGAAIGVTFAGDLITLFVFWELMTLGAVVLIWGGGMPASRVAGSRYLGIHLAGGTAMLAGIVRIWLDRKAAGLAGDGLLAFGHLGAIGAGDLDRAHLGPLLVLLGMLVNAGAPPFSAWIPDAYPEATPAGTVFLSAFTTKTAVFTLLVAFAGSPLLVGIGLAMAFYGIVYAILENDMRRILAYSIVNQVGFMVAGVGVGTPLAVNGAVAHAFAHILYKGLLLMSAGAVLHATGMRLCTRLGGLARAMPLSMACGLVGALSISGVPLTSGFTTKTMISAACAERVAELSSTGLPTTGLLAAWLLLEAAAAGVFLHAGIKFPWFVFFHRDSGLAPPEPPVPMRVAMVTFSAACILLGVWPDPLYALLPHPAAAAAFRSHVYDPGHVLETLELLVASGLAFFLLLPVLRRTETITLDWDVLWRRLASRAWARAIPALRALDRAWASAGRRIVTLLAGSDHGEPLPLPHPWTASQSVFLISALLLAYWLAHLLGA